MSNFNPTFDIAPTKATVNVKSSLKAARSTGILTLSNRGIDELPPQIFELDQCLEDDEKFWEVYTLLIKIDCSHNIIRSISPQIGMFHETLTSLVLRGNEIEEVVPELYSLQQLVKLDLSRNNIRHLDPLISSLTSLKDFSISGNQINEIPGEVGMMGSLERLDGSENQISHLLFHLPPSLRSLNLSKNRITDIHEDLFEGCSFLELVDLSKNDLPFLPPSIKSCESLSFLDVQNNHISSFPPLPSQSLREAYLGYNEISSFRSFDITAFSILPITQLHLQSNQIRNLPEEVFKHFILLFLYHSLDGRYEGIEGVGYIK